MAKYYFTYGTGGHPFIGGWTEVEAPDLDAACGAFRAYHPDTTEGFLNCAYIYPEEWFRETRMFSTGNFGFRCREIITIHREVLKTKSEGGECQ